MNRRQVLSSLGLASAGAVAVPWSSAFAEEPDAGDDSPEVPATACSFEECGDACRNAARACNASFNHCTTLIQSGKRGYTLALRTCIDCSEVCTTCASLCSRESRLAKVLTEACARFCDRAAVECEKLGNDRHFQECVRHCRTCAAHCRGLIEDVLIA